MTLPKALVVDDEPDIRELLEITLGRMDVETVCAENLERAFDALTRDAPDLCLTDMRLPDGNGIDLVRRMSQQHPDVPVAVITAHGDVSSAVEALKAGAFDFVTKPVDLPVLRSLVKTALRMGRGRRPGGETLIGDSEAMRQVRATIAKLARSQAPVFISGESGTGKELAARMIHEQGPRAEYPFVPVNCGAIPADLMESELFGHRKGAFTGAVQDKSGLFQAAQSGTLFLDEVAELPLEMQVKLLRAIQEKTVRPVGSEAEVAVDVRVLSASHKQLAELVRAGAFREDLYYRLDVITLRLPPLRERAEDIPQLANHILERLSQGSDQAGLRIGEDALEALSGYDFPGNVRELENILERAITLRESDCIGSADLGLTRAPAPAAPARRASDLDGMLEDVEKQRIMNALEEARWNKTRAAKLLGISFGALRYRMQKLGLD